MNWKFEVVDSKKDRREAIVKSFLRSEGEHASRWQKVGDWGGIPAASPGSDQQEPEAPYLLLIHLNDINSEDVSAVPLIQSGLRRAAATIVIYSGGPILRENTGTVAQDADGKKRRWTGVADERICVVLRPIDEFNAGTIFRTALERHDPFGDRRAFCAALQDEEAAAPETLIALAILCQGYLAVHASAEGPESERHPKVRAALTAMGWTTDLALPDGEPGRVNEADWWLGAFGGKIEYLPETEEGDWILGTASVRSLIDDLNSGNPIQDLVRVSEAYCAIAAKLGGPACESV